MRLPATVKWIGLALLGLIIAAAVAIAASNLAGQQIGISNESLSAGDQLAPAVAPGENGGAPNKPRRTEPAPPNTVPTEPPTTPAETAPSTEPPPEAAPASPAEPRDDSGGGQGGGSDD